MLVCLNNGLSRSCWFDRPVAFMHFLWKSSKDRKKQVLIIKLKSISHQTPGKLLQLSFRGKQHEHLLLQTFQSSEVTPLWFHFCSVIAIFDCLWQTCYLHNHGFFSCQALSAVRKQRSCWWINLKARSWCESVRKSGVMPCPIASKTASSTSWSMLRGISTASWG